MLDGGGRGGRELVVVGVVVGETEAPLSLELDEVETERPRLTLPFAGVMIEGTPPAAKRGGMDL